MYSVVDILITLDEYVSFIEERQNKARGIDTHTKLQDKAINVLKVADSVRENLALISAAPDLLEALKELVSLVSQDNRFECIDPSCKCEGNEREKDAFERAMKAIEKAEYGK